MKSTEVCEKQAADMIERQNDERWNQRGHERLQRPKQVHAHIREGAAARPSHKQPSSRVHDALQRRAVNRERDLTSPHDKWQQDAFEIFTQR